MNAKIIVAISALCTISSSCGVNQSEYEKMKEELSIYKTRIVQDSVEIIHLRDTIEMLSFPAQQRLVSINRLIADGDYTKARNEISQLCSLFPESEESKQTPAILEKMDNLLEKRRIADERTKALGFKAIKPNTSTTIGYNKVTLSNISVGNKFIFDSYDDSWRYRTADRGNVFVTAVMTITSSLKNPDLPTLAIYSINGDQMNREEVMEVRFARWENYGTYLGNYSDYGNDFAKTSTIKFKIGAEVAAEITKKPYAIILKKCNGLSRNYNRYDNPPVSYTGSISYPYVLSVNDFSGENSEYLIVKISNL